MLFRKNDLLILRKGICTLGQKLFHGAVRTKGNLDSTTLIPVVSAAGISYKPVIVSLGKQAHYRRCRGDVQTFHTLLPPCYL